jgi:caffeoyl-CoA O-methyltransferase
MATTAADATATVPKEQTTTNGAEQVTRHSEVGHKSLLQSDALYQVLLAEFFIPKPEIAPSPPLGPPLSLATSLDL